MNEILPPALQALIPPLTAAEWLCCKAGKLGWEGWTASQNQYIEITPLDYPYYHIAVCNLPMGTEDYTKRGIHMSGIPQCLAVMTDEPFTLHPKVYKHEREDAHP